MTGHEHVLDEKLAEILDAKGADVYTTSPEATVAEAVGEMNARGVGALVVMEKGRPIGIFTERDVLRRLVGEGRDCRGTKVADMMTREVIMIGPDITVGEAMAIVTGRRLRHLPVVEGGKLVGLVSSGDLTMWVTRRQEIHIRDLAGYIQGTYPV
jgi:CBS domain-containing protein